MLGQKGELCRISTHFLLWRLGRCMVGVCHHDNCRVRLSLTLLLSYAIQIWKNS